MDRFETTIGQACEDRILHGVVVAATNSAGTINYLNSFGKLSLSPEHVEKSMKPDTVFQIASCTKLVTSIAALQCVERGLIGLDDDIQRTVPQLAELEILDKFREEEEPVTKKRKTPMTLRHLLTHTSGLGYDIMTPKLMRYRASKNQLPGQGKTLLERFGIPLVFEPGTSWGYGASLDWAGRIVEQLTGQSLEKYFTENIWQPLGIRDMTFFIDLRPDMKARLSGLCVRDDDSGEVVPYEGSFLQQPKECLGGQGLYSTMPEYVKILHSLLKSDGKLLSKATIEQMFSPQLPDVPRQFLNRLRTIPEVWSNFPGQFPPNVELDWGLGGMLTRNSDPGWRKKHTLVWSGLPNLFWFIDRESDLCGCFGTQVFPPGDKQTNDLISIFEKNMYQLSAVAKQKL